MAGVLGSCSSPLVRPLHHRTSPRRCFRVSAELNERSAPSPTSVIAEGEDGSSSSSSASSSPPPLLFSPPAGFKSPQPKPFSVSPDKFLDILGASLALPFRLGTGAFVQGFTNCLLLTNYLYAHILRYFFFSMLSASKTTELTNKNVSKSFTCVVNN